MDLSDLVHGLKPKSRSHRDEAAARRDPLSSTSPHTGSGQAGRGQSSKGRQTQGASQTHRERTEGGASSSQGRTTRQSQNHASQHISEVESDSSSSSPPRPIPGSRAGSSSADASKLRCELCSRTFTSQTQFDQHKSVFHKRGKTPVKPREASFVCNFCGKGFTSPSKRIVHQNATHKGLRPFQCTLCTKAFGYKGDLTKHMATHSGIKDHACYICGAKFARNFYVKRHIETVHEKKQTPKP